MTKKRTAPSSKSATNSSKKSYREKILGSKRFKEATEHIRSRKVAYTFFAVAMVFAYLCPLEGIGQYAMLYLIADNAKKSGRAGGNVYMRNGRIRGFRVPSLVQNEATSTQRNNFSSFSASWNSLTALEQQSFINAVGFFKSDRFGQAVPLVGKELYVSLNRALFNIGAAAITTAPLPAEVPAVDSLVVAASTAAGGSLTLTFSPAITPGSPDAYKVFATAQLSPGTYRPSKSAFRLLTVLDDTETSPEDIHALYVARFGSLVAGRKVFIKMVGVNGTTGQQGTGIISSDIVA